MGLQAAGHVIAFTAASWAGAASVISLVRDAMGSAALSTRALNIMSFPSTVECLPIPTIPVI